ncbi:MAG: amidophosphoribosyltransferase, partial [Planctomycetota bacterium]
PKYFTHEGLLTDDAQQRLADDLGADSLRYLPVEAISRAIGKPANHLCQACVTGHYPTECGQHLYQIALDNRGNKLDSKRTYEQLAAVIGTGP